MILDLSRKAQLQGHKSEVLTSAVSTQVILDLGRKPEARFQGHKSEVLAERLITREDLAAACSQVGDFGGDNRAGIEGKLHRISAMRNRSGDVVGLTCRVGRAVTGHIDMIKDLLEGAFSFHIFLFYLVCAPAR